MASNKIFTSNFIFVLLLNLFDLLNDLVDLGSQAVDLGDRLSDLSVEGFDIDLLSGVFGLHIGADREVVVVVSDSLMLCGVGEVGDLLFACEDLHDLVDVLLFEQVGVGRFFKELARVDELRFRVAFMLREHQDIDGDRGAVKEVGCQGNDGFDIVVVDEVFADLLLRTAAVEDAGKADDRRASFGGEVMERVKYEGKVGFGLGRQHARGGEAVVVDEGGVVAADPLDGVGGIGDDGIEGLVIVVLGVGEGIAELDIELVVVDIVQKHIHPREVVGGMVDLLTEKTLFDDMRVELLFGLQQQ